jgi:hypothetical protein
MPSHTLSDDEKRQELLVEYAMLERFIKALEHPDPEVALSLLDAWPLAFDP